MDPIQLMMDEHQLILRVLDALDSCARGVDSGAEVQLDDVRGFITFIEQFADLKHHAKEEDILFEEMVGAGFPRQAGPIAVMMYEHDEGRGQVAVMQSCVESAGPWSDETRETFRAAATNFSSLLRAHIRKEDHVLYPMAMQRLSSDAMQRVASRCETVEQQKADSGETERLETLARQLIERYPAG